MAGTRSAQLEWEARWAKPVGICAAIFAIGGLAAGVTTRMVLGTPPDPGPAGALLWINSQAEKFIGLTVVQQGLLALFVIPVIVYLYQAAKARDERLLSVARNLAIFGAVAIAAAAVVGATEIVATAAKFSATPDAAALTRTLDPPPASPQGESLEEAISTAIGQTSVVREAVIDASNEAAIASQGRQTMDIWDGVNLAGAMAFAFALLMISSAASRAGLVSRFLGYVGVAIGALTGLSALMTVAGQPPILNPFVIQIFWIGALGLIFVNRWPNGRGPAWDSGQAKPWPTAAEQRAALEQKRAAQIEARSAPPPADAPSGNGEPSRPPGRKKKKRSR